LPHVMWGDSDKVRVGDWVVAVGNPFGLGGTVTAGIISARGRDIQTGRFDDYLQIDAPINRGNSGGPSFDRSGAVIGVNSAIFASAGGSIGIGFAVPSALARSVLQELRDHGRIDRGWLGLAIQPVTREIADALGLSEVVGVLVISVVAGGPAAKSGLQSGDVIRSVDGQKIVDTRVLGRRVGFAAPEKVVLLEVWRDGRAISVTTVLGRTPTAEDDNGPTREKVQPTTKNEPRTLGLSVLRISPETQQRYGLSPDATGLLVIGIAPGSSAAEAGLLPGDILVRAGNKTIDDQNDLEAAVDAARAASRKAILLLTQSRDGAEKFVAVTIP
jgi:serine protease Do